MNTTVQSRQPPSDGPVEKLGHGVARAWTSHLTALGPYLLL